MDAWEEEVLQLLNQLRQNPTESKEMHEFARDLVPVPRLHLSMGLCSAARDVVCYLRTFGFIASHSAGESPICTPFLSRYGRVERGPILENFAYKFNSPAGALAQILTSNTPHIHGPKTQLCAPEVRVVGLAIASHSSELTCLVLVLCGGFFDREASGEPTQALAAEFYPARIAKRVTETVRNR